MNALRLLALASLLAGCAAIEQTPVRALSDTPVTGFAFPESVGCDAAGGVLYVSQFGGTELKPGEKDGLGFVSKVSLGGKVIEKKAFDVTMNKPKGIWIAGERLWVTDIDGLWIFDTKTKQGRKVAIPGAEFANDVAVNDGVAYVSDNRTDQLFRIEPADYLEASVQPRVSAAWSKRDVNPNGVWPARDGSLLMVGFLSADKPRAIFSMGKDGEPKAISAPIGRLDGLYEMRDGSLLYTDWNTGSLTWWTKNENRVIAKDFKGPADFCVMDGIVYVPDLVKGEVRVIRLGR
jgi:hypothetical protein